MAHNIQKRDVQVGNEMAWHKLTQIEPVIDKGNCRIAYPMAIAPTFFKGPNGEEIKGNGRQIYSLDDNLPIGRCVGDDYKLLSNEAIWDAAIAGIAGTSHKIVSCGTVDNRATGFISIKTAENFTAAGREHNPIMNVVWGHGGNRAVVAKTGLTTIVCQNTLNLAMSEKSDFRLSIRHTANANVLDLGKAIDAHIGVAAEFQKAMEAFHSVDVTASDARKIYAGFLTNGEVPETKTGISRLTNTVDRLTELFLTGAGNAGKTRADLVNGVTDYYSHESSGGDNLWKQFTSSEFGSAAAKKSEFFRLVGDESSLIEMSRRGESVLATLGL